MTASLPIRSAMMGQAADAASVLYAPALAEVVGYELIPDKPRVRGGILITFRDERGALVTIRLMHKAVGHLLRALEADPVAQIADGKPLPNLIEVQPNTVLEIGPIHEHDQVNPGTLPLTGP